MITLAWYQVLGWVSVCVCARACVCSGYGEPIPDRLTHPSLQDYLVMTSMNAWLTRVTSTLHVTTQLAQWDALVPRDGSEMVTIVQRPTNASMWQPVIRLRNALIRSTPTSVNATQDSLAMVSLPSHLLVLHTFRICCQLHFSFKFLIHHFPATINNYILGSKINLVSLYYV